MSIFRENVQTILEARYLKRKADGSFETHEDMIRRVAKCAASAEKDEEAQKRYEDEFYGIIESLDFLPNSPTFMNAGKEDGQLSACFVLPIEDSIESIMNTVKRAAVIHKTGGGTGIILSKIRPRNFPVNSTLGVASGPCSFLRIFDTTTDVIKQGGVRRGANIGSLKITHPDIEEFVSMKSDGGLSNFNISAVVTDEFMRRVLTGRRHNLLWRGEKIKQVKASSLFDLIAENAWNTGDPGLLFYDAINRDNPTPWLGRIEGTNPCGEEPLLAYESCNLGSINLTNFVRDGSFNKKALGDTVRLAVRFLDNIIDVNCYPNVKIRNATRQTRKIGLGVMGWADMLVMLGLEYDSEEALDLADRMMKFIRDTAYKASEELARERGAFPQFRRNGRRPRRNACLLAMAPTGTISMLAGVSSGIEPIFSRNYVKVVLDNQAIPLSEGYQGKTFKTAHEISYRSHIDMQAVFQKYTDAGVSKTINMPEEATVQDVKDAYIYAWQNNAKGVTIFRNNCKDGVYLDFSDCQNGRCELL